ncbi:MAG TPA: hypothetical protein VFV38_31180 [Ktedonobacteraceae bacterium]|nr:hypothetical protein [Ktedonobacteraceae bacterium]
MASQQEAIWVMGCYERGILRLFLIGARNELEAHHKGGIILRKRQNLWFDSLEEGAKYLEIYPPEQIHDKETTVTMYDQRYYEEPY